MLNLNKERIGQLEKAAHNTSMWIKFLDNITEIDELDAVIEYASKHNLYQTRSEIVDLYYCSLKQWPNPDDFFPLGFSERFPLVGKKLNSATKRLFLRAADFCCADPWFFANIVEEILYAHEVEGKKRVEIEVSETHWSRWKDHPKNARCFVTAVLAWYTQLQVWTFRELFLDDPVSSGGPKRHWVWE
ncbi:MAG: hypothetical protein ABIG90_00160 [bacterium]